MWRSFDTQHPIVPSCTLLRRAWEVNSARSLNDGLTGKQQRKRGKYFVFPYFHEENVSVIATKETVGTDSPKHILKHLENCEKRQQEKLDKTAETFKSGPSLNWNTPRYIQTKKQHTRFL